jgi:hypothetical protein
MAWGWLTRIVTENSRPTRRVARLTRRTFGRTDRYANRDNQEEFTTTVDGTAWDTGRNSSITDGSRVEKDLREADADTPGVIGPKPDRPEPDR